MLQDEKRPGERADEERRCGEPFPSGPRTLNDLGAANRGLRLGGARRRRQRRANLRGSLNFVPAWLAPEEVLLEGLGHFGRELVRDVPTHEIPFLNRIAREVFGHVRHCCSRSSGFVTPMISASLFRARWRRTRIAPGCASKRLAISAVSNPET